MDHDRCHHWPSLNKRLGSDVLTLVLSFLEGMDLTRFYIASNGEMREMMRNVVEQFWVKSWKPTKQPVWPKILKYFPNLLSLSITLDEQSSHIPIIQLDLSIVPDTLEYLELDFINSHMLFSSPPRDFPLPHLSFHQIHYAHLNGRFKNIKTLRISGSKSHLGDDFILHLPKHSITDLTLMGSSLSSSCIQTLPPRLVNLVLHGKFHFNEQVSSIIAKHLPALQKLELAAYSFQSNQKQSDAPPHPMMIDDHSSTSAQGSHQNKSNIRHHFSFPPGLTSLTIPDCPNLDFLSLLPQSLQTLCLVSYPAWSTAASSNLPRNLSSLTLRYGPTDGSEVVQDKSIAGLPPTLKLLHLHSGTGIRGTTFAHLPPTLTKLFLMTNTHIRDHAIQALPRTVLTLCLQNAQQITTAAIKDFPPKLESLWLGRATSVDPMSYHLLPRTLTELRLYDGCDDCIPLLPPNLVYLRFFSEDCNFTSKMVNLLPKSITKLGFNSPHFTIDTETLESNPTEELKWPPKLVEICCENAPLFNDLCIQSLPKSLTSLILFASPQVTGESFKFLPRQLIQLKAFMTCEFSNQHIADLPQRLYVLTLGESKLIDNEGMKSLPRLLSELEIQTGNLVTDTCFPYLPPYLYSIDFSEELMVKWRKHVLTVRTPMTDQTDYGTTGVATDCIPI